MRQRQISIDEYIKWWKDKGDELHLNETMLKEMESEGMVFEIRETDEGYEYPFINSDHWKGRNDKLR